MFNHKNLEIKGKYLVGILLFCLVLSAGLGCAGIPDFLNKIHLGHGKILLEKHLYVEAIEELNKIINNSSTRDTAYTDRAMAYYYLGDYEKALADCSVIVDIPGKAWYAYYLKSHISNKLNNYQEALDNINLAISLSNGIEAMTYSTRAMTYFNLGKYYETLNDCDKAIQIDSSDSLAYKVRGTVFLQAGQIDSKELDKAIIDFNKSISMNPNDAETYYNRALAYITQKKYAEAATDLEKALSLCQEPSDIEKINQKLAEIQP